MREGFRVGLGFLILLTVGVESRGQIVAYGSPTSASRWMSTLGSGPLHESYVIPESRQPMVIVPKQPPEPLVERPKVESPSDQARWVPGYWEWETQRKEYVWVTGSWRIAPPGRTWVAPFWTREEGGWVRWPGYWSDPKTDRKVSARNGPPESQPQPGDRGEPPTKGDFYLRGHYEPAPDGEGVVWKDGFWSRPQEDWSWVGAQWVRRPDGWIYHTGFWDYPFLKRGTLFLPGREAPMVARRKGIVFEPWATVDSFKMLVRIDTESGWMEPAKNRFVGDVSTRAGLLASYGRNAIPWMTSPMWSGGNNQVPTVPHTGGAGSGFNGWDRTFYSYIGAPGVAHADYAQSFGSYTSPPHGTSFGVMYGYPGGAYPSVAPPDSVSSPRAVYNAFSYPGGAYPSVIPGGNGGVSIPNSVNSFLGTNGVSP